MTPRISDDVQTAASILRSGGIVGMPTETVYGLAALAHDEKAVRRIFDVKGRPRTHPLIVHLACAEDAPHWGLMDDAAHSLADARWPGPLTILVRRTSRAPDWVTGGRDTVALRVPDHPTALALLALVDDGIVAPSANRFGRVSPTRAEHVRDDLGDDVDLVLDGGPCAVGVESTIVECTGPTLQVLRPGAVTAEEISAITGLALVDTTADARAPGMMLSHYAPRARVVLVYGMDEADTQCADFVESGDRCVVLHEDDPERYALTLYDRLREADAAGVDVVVAVMPRAEGIGIAVRDRLAKAAGIQAT